MTTTKEFIYFTFPKIGTFLDKDGKEKKKPVGLPDWREVDENNYKSFVNKYHHCRANLTGNISGITVIDFDNLDSYNRMVEEYPDLKKNKTIKTKNGFHIYCEYDATVKTTTNASEKYAGIDIRNDGAVVFAPPTTYKLLDGTIISYDDLGGEILPIPDIIRNNLKMFDTKNEKKTIKIKINKKIATGEKDAEEVVENNMLGNYDKFVKMKDCYSPERLKDYDDYIKFSIAVKLCFGESGRKIWNDIC
jgi:archaellum component FlaF (FlaF/FlaG flagellin family)